ncbi:hypothetical protein [Oceanicola sp. S124]|uniref:hypothetical protein n=1 Tax=Oceanicola sp. S124 TaxID=1042378 RepID=UPI0002557A98|nr:hypothetical protein [Oceanicola sp. S124]
MTAGAGGLWRLLPVAGLILLATATVLSHHLQGPGRPEEDILEIGAPFVATYFPPAPFPPAMSGEALPTALVAAAGWIALGLSVPRLLRARQKARRLLLMLPGAALALVAFACFLLPGSLPELLALLQAVNVVLVLVAAAISVIALPLRLLWPRRTGA